MAETHSRYFEFGEFQLDAHRRVLRKNGSDVHLTPRAFDLLYVMLESAGRTLDHDELLERVWPGTFVEQGNLKKAVSALRRALGESPENNQFIITVPRRGYRFGTGVRTLPDDTVLIRETRSEILIEEEIDDHSAAGPALPEPGFFTRSRLIFAGASIFLLIIGAFVAWPRFGMRPQRVSAENVEITRLMSEGDIAGGAISADGNLLVYALREGAERGLWVRQVNTGSAIRIQAPVDASFWDMTFSPDGNFVYYTLHSDIEPAAAGLYRIPTLGGAPTLISPGILLGSKFSPDGRRLAVYRTLIEDGKEKQELLTLNGDGSEMRSVTALPFDSLFRGIAWSPDGSSLVYGAKIQAPTEKPRHYIAEIPSGGGTERVLMPVQDKILYVEDWLPDGQSILLRQRERHSESYQVWQYFPATGETTRVTNDDYSYTSLSPARDGKTLGAFRSFSLSSVWTSTDGGTDFREILTGTNSPFRLDWTANGKIVFSTTEASRERVGIMSADGENKRLLTDGTDGILLYPRVSGDGKSVTFISDRSESRQLWRIDPDGRNSSVQLTFGVGIGDGRLLADNTTVIYRTWVPASSFWSLFKRIGNADAAQLTDIDVYDWDISPDEKYLAIHTSGSAGKKDAIQVRDVATGALIKGFDIDDLSCLRWTRDSAALSYIRFDGNGHEIVELPLSGGEPKVVSSISGEQFTNFSWAPDGHGLAVVRNRPNNEAVLFRTAQR